MALYDDAKVIMFGSAGASKPTGGINGASTTGRLYSVKPTDGSGDFSVRRGSNLAATRVGPDGLIEKGRENLVPYSNQFDQAYASGGWATNRLSLTTGQLGYDGSNNAFLLTVNDVSNPNSVIPNNITLTGVITLSVFVKANTLTGGSGSNPQNTIRLSIREFVTGSDPQTNKNSRAFFNLKDGTVGSKLENCIASSIEPAGNGFFRCSATFDIPSTNTADRPETYLGNGDTTIDSNTIGDSIFIQDFQVEAGFAATDVITTGASTATAGCQEDEARFDFTNDGPCRILQEPTRTNIVTHSEGITLATVSAAAPLPSIESAPTEVSPSGHKGGVVQASNLQSQTGDRIRLGFSSITDGDTVSGYFYIKGDSGKTINVTLKRNGAGDFRGTTITHTCDGEWQKVGPIENVTMDGGNDEAAMFLVNATNGSNTLDSCLLWGYQIEKATYSTSYIPSYGVATERTGDLFVLGKSGATLQDEGFITSSAGTLFVDIPANGYGVATHVHWDLKHVTNGHHRLRIYFQSSTSAVVRQTDSDEVQTDLLTVTGLPANGQRKVAVSWNGTSVKVGINGVYYDSTTTPAVSAMDSDIAADLQEIRRSNNTGMQCDVNSVMVFNSQLTQSQLESLTTL